MDNGFEDVFGRFVQSIGGEIVPRGVDESADYLFRPEKVVVELKTLVEDSTLAYAKKLYPLTNDWQRRGLVRGFGTFSVELHTLPLECQQEFLNLLEASIERVIRKANGQIRSTKEVHKLPNAKGLLLIANDGNFLHTNPVNFMISVGRILQKKDEFGEHRYPHIRGVVYFSYRVPSAGESTLFWRQGTMEPTSDADLRMLQERLRREWFAFHAKIYSGRSGKIG